MDSFKNKTILITGASAGIGKLFAEKLAAQGAHLLLVARREKQLEELAKNLRDRYGVTVDYLKSDLSRTDAPWLIHEWARAQGWEIDALINNAGFGEYGSFATMDISRIQTMMQVNMQALVLLTRLYLPEIKKQKGGVLNIASTAAFQPIPFLGLYAATKSFVKSFSESLWLENRDIRVFCLCPGNTESEFHDVAGIHQKKVFLRATTESLVDFGLQQFLKSASPTRVHGFLNACLAVSNRLVPTRLALWIAHQIYEIRTRASK